MTLKIILGIILAGVLSNNYALLHFLGTGAVIENDRSTKKSLILGLGTTIVMVITTAITWFVNTYLLASLPYLQTMAFVIVILAVVEILHVIAKKLLDGYCRADFVKFAINGAVLGLCIHNTELGFAEAVVTAAAVGIGFMLTMTLFSKLIANVDEDSVPESFRGLPIALLTAGMIVLALLTLNFKF
ncbi:MAG: Rnf-Nqr domain containing protein [Clostridia bacterium]|nr:Rnf-Nqr domain containing protein [Clostridia bacterium]